MSVEQAAIAMAEAYAAENKVDGPANAAPGIVLGGMVVMALVSDACRAEMLRVYRTAFPEDMYALEAWAKVLDAEVEPVH